MSSLLKAYLAKRSQRNDETGCLVWQGQVDRNGHGRAKLRDLSIPAQRASYEVHIGMVPRGQRVRQKCDNLLCIEPTHLYLQDPNAQSQGYGQGQQDDRVSPLLPG